MYLKVYLCRKEACFSYCTGLCKYGYPISCCPHIEMQLNCLIYGTIVGEVVLMGMNCKFLDKRSMLVQIQLGAVIFQSITRGYKYNPFFLYVIKTRIKTLLDA